MGWNNSSQRFQIPTMLLNMDEDEFRELLVSTGYSDDAADKELEGLREYKRRFKLQTTVEPEEEDDENEFVQAAARRRRRIDNGKSERDKETDQ